ncbi:hypothetical protein [Microbispora sp. CA-102843]|uniref:hypothetical protein n=1 Tax=Microbispora sp. CA-102843 TaxID=3239952 RepID=UPI003D8C8363
MKFSHPDCLHALLAQRTPEETAIALRGLLQVPDGKRASELERLRTPPVRASGKVLAYQLDRVAEIGNLGACRSSSSSPAH